MSWPIRSLASICDMQIGKTPSRSNPSFWNGLHPWATISDFQQGRCVRSTKESITDAAVHSCGCKVATQGTLLLSFKLSVGKRAFAGTDLFTNEAIAALTPKDSNALSLAYLYWALGDLDYDANADRAAKGKTLNKAKLSALLIPVPPLPEQKRIAAILDAADALRAKRRESIEQLDSLIQATFLEMFGDPVTNLKGWETKEAAAIVRDGTIITYGIVQAGDEFPGGVPYIRTGDIVNGEVAVGQLRRTNPAIAAKFERSRVDAGDIVMSIRATVGTCALITSSVAGANLTQGTARLAPSFRVLSKYLLHFIRTKGCQQWIQQQVKGATFREITLGRLRQMPVLLPPLSLQKRFASIVESIEQQKAGLKAHLAELDTLFASLQSRAFNGELVA